MEIQHRRGFLKSLIAAPAIIAATTSFTSKTFAADDDGGLGTLPQPTRTPSPRMQAFTNAISTSILYQAIEVRAQHGCGRLHPNAELYDAARSHTQDMYSRQFFDHITPEGLGPRERVSEDDRLPYRKLGENLWRTWGVHEWSVSKTATNVIQGWLDSPGHRRVLLDPEYNTGGVAARGDEDELFVTMLYAKPL